ncbi:MAG: hypothetical protein VKL42_11635 [Snowella sp.]|nr:hypothetical protein [Snowella sp.]
MSTKIFVCLVLGSIPLWANLSENSVAQVSPDLTPLTTPPPLKVPQPLPATIYAGNPSPVPFPAPPLPQVNPSGLHQEYIFRSTAIPAPPPQNKPAPIPPIQKPKSARSVTVNTPTIKPATIKPEIVNTSAVMPAIAPSNHSSTNQNALYWVQIIGQDTELLQRVQKIEPLAFIRNADGTIQAGTFPQASLAQQRLAALAQAGITGQIISGQENGRSQNNLNVLRYQRLEY